MTYIVLDMEWSQPVCKEKMLTKGGRTLPVEIIQIGAVMVKDGKIIEEQFSEYVKPIYYTIIKNRIKKLTGINEKELKKADTFGNVLRRLRTWIDKYGGDTICTWGCDDVSNLRAQCEFFGFGKDWIPPWFNLQPLVTRQLQLQRTQINLATAVELMGITSELTYHSAINDAYYTALILLGVNNIEEGIKWQKKVDYAHANPYKQLCVTSYGKRKYTRTVSALRSPELRRYVCPLCGRPSTLKDRLVNIKPCHYLAVMKCAKHTLAVNVEFQKTEEGRYEWKKKITLCDTNTERTYQEKMRKKSARVSHLRKEK
ncbi:MAG: exonuclease domain-containing protein [Ruminiclostridium sp.]|nr:exonuclease domain-containing protein [Ruminiclostridium sp.]